MQYMYKSIVMMGLLLGTVSVLEAMKQPVFCTGTDGSKLVYRGEKGKDDCMLDLEITQKDLETGGLIKTYKFKDQTLAVMSKYGKPEKRDQKKRDQKKRQPNNKYPYSGCSSFSLRKKPTKESVAN